MSEENDELAGIHLDAEIIYNKSTGLTEENIKDLREQLLTFISKVVAAEDIYTPCTLSGQSGESKDGQSEEALKDITAEDVDQFEKDFNEWVNLKK